MKSRSMLVVRPTLDLKPNAVHIEEALDIAGHGRYNYVLTLACSLINLGSILDMLGFSIVIPAASCDLQLSLEQSGLLNSISFAGYIFALPWGYYADTYGRRKAILISSIVGFIISAINSFSTNFLMMLILKFIGCSFSSASLPLSVTYLGECIQKKHRNEAIFILNCFDVAMDLVTYGLAYIILPLDFSLPLWSTFTYKPWRLLSLTFAVPLILGALMIVFLYESPKFLANKGEMVEALEVLKSTYEINGGDGDSFPVTALIGNHREDENVPFWETMSRQTVSIFKPPLLWRTVQLFYLLTVCCVTNNVFYLWFPTMINSFYNNAGDGNDMKNFCERIIANVSVTMNETEPCNDHTPMNTIYAGMLFSVFFVVLNLFLIMLSSRRKLLLVTTLVISGFGAALLNLFEDQTINLTLFILIQLSGTLSGIIGSYFVDVYPTSYRGFASSLAMMMCRLACLGGVNLVGALFVDHCQLTFYGCAIFVLSGVVTALLLPSDREGIMR